MEWLLDNWFWVLFASAFILMHLFGHGCHGGHKKKDESKKHSGN